MARLQRTSQIFNFFLYFTVILSGFTNLVSANEELNEDNWRKMLEGEWFVKFYAPWCPACTLLEKNWNEMSEIVTKKGIPVKIGSVDITRAPGLSGRFVLTALPTIYHVKNGEFGQYRGPQNPDYMARHVEFDGYQYTEHISPWRSPNSIQMSLVAELFKLSQFLRDMHDKLTKSYRLPTWAAYSVFTFVTVIIGIMLGLIVVFVIDLVSSIYAYRRSKVYVSREEAEKRKKDDKKNEDQETVNEDIVDDVKDKEDAEKHSQKDNSDEETAAEGAGDTKAEAEDEVKDKKSSLEAQDDKSSEVRKRRPRRAD